MIHEFQEEEDKPDNDSDNEVMITPVENFNIDEAYAILEKLEQHYTSLDDVDGVQSLVTIISIRIMRAFRVEVVGTPIGRFGPRGTESRLLMHLLS